MRFHFVLEGRMEIQARMSDCVAVVDLLDAVAEYARLPPPPIYLSLSSVNHEPSILTMRRDGQKRKIIRKMCI